MGRLLAELVQERLSRQKKITLTKVGRPESWLVGKLQIKQWMLLKDVFDVTV